MSTAAGTACGRCGREGREVVQSAALGARVCLDCHAARPPARAPKECDVTATYPLGAVVPTPSPSPDPGPSPSNGGSTREEDESFTRWLLSEHGAGMLDPVPIDAPEPPATAPPLALAIYEDIRLRWGLRLGQLENRPLPYATSEPVRAGLCGHKMQASRALHWLEDHALIWSPGSMPPRNGQDGTVVRGTRTFLPGRRPDCLTEGEAVVVEGRAEVVAREADQPEVRLVDQSLVGRAELASPLGEDRAPAVGNRAGGAADGEIRHGGDASPPTRSASPPPRTTHVGVGSPNRRNDAGAGHPRSGRIERTRAEGDKWDPGLADAFIRRALEVFRGSVEIGPEES